jgi:hypothetical protein
MKKVRSPAPSSFSTLLMGLARSTDKARSEPPAHRYAQLLLQKSHDLRPPRKIPLSFETRRARYLTDDPENQIKPLKPQDSTPLHEIIAWMPRLGCSQNRTAR